MKKFQVLGFSCRPSVRVLVPHGFASIFQTQPPLPSANSVTAAAPFLDFSGYGISKSSFPLPARK